MGQSGDAAKGQAVAQLAGVYKLSSREGEGRQRAAEPAAVCRNSCRLHNK